VFLWTGSRAPRQARERRGRHRGAGQSPNTQPWHQLLNVSLRCHTSQRIGAAGTDQWECGTAKETVKHFLFLCAWWDHLRAPLLQQAGARTGDISFCLRGKVKECGDGPDTMETDHERRPGSCSVCSGHRTTTLQRSRLNPNLKPRHINH
jgi:hypothetical protein